MRRWQAALLVFWLCGLSPATAWAASMSPSRVVRNEGATAPLTGRSMANLVAFARLYGRVRFFHPSDEAARADWDHVALDHVLEAEAAPDRAALLRTLRRTFQPLAPTMTLAVGWPVARAMPKTPGAWMAWRHEGVRLAEGTIYDSRRSIDTDVGPGEVSVVSLSGGLFAAIPLSLPPTPGYAVPVRGSDRSAPIYATPREDRATRLADVVITWAVLESFYPYAHEAGVDWTRQLREALRTAATDRDALQLENTLGRMTASLGDGHAVAAGRRWTHLLPLSWDWVEGELVVTAVATGAAPLRPGDVVVTLDGRPAAQAIATRMTVSSGSRVAWRRYLAVSSLLATSGDGLAHLDVRRSDGARFKFDLPYSRPASEGAVSEARPASGVLLAPGVYYLDLTTLTDKSLGDLEPVLLGAKSIIADARGHPSEAALTFLRRLSAQPLRSGRFNTPIVTRHDRRTWRYEDSGWNLAPLFPTFTARTIFLADETTYSFGETVMEMVEAYRLGTIVGRTTAGVNGNRNDLPLPGGFRVSFTGMQVLKHDGSPLYGVGIRPQVRVNRTIAGIRAGREDVIDRALALVGG